MKDRDPYTFSQSQPCQFRGMGGEEWGEGGLNQEDGAPHLSNPSPASFPGWVVRNGVRIG